MKKEMSWKNVLGLKHSHTSVGEYKETSANTFKWIFTLGVKSSMNVSNF
jgi:hypothetical protein